MTGLIKKKTGNGEGSGRPVIRLFVCVFILLLFTRPVFSGTVFLDESTRTVNLAEGLELFEDPDGSKTFDEIRMLKKGRWEISQAESVNAGYTASAFWIRVELTNRSKKPLRFLVEVGYPVLDHVETFAVRENSVDTWDMGDKRPFRERPVDYPGFVTPLSFSPGETLSFYARIRTTSSMQFPLRLFSLASFLEMKQFSMMIQGLYYGSMIIMALYNLFLFVSVRESNYLTYVVYVVFQCLFLASMNGLTFQYLWPDSVSWNDQAIVVSLCVMIFSANFSIVRFMKLSPADGLRYSMFLMFAITAMAIVLLSFVLPFRLGILFTAFLILACFIFGLPVVILRWTQGYSPGRFFSLAWLFLGCGAIVLVFNKIGLIPRSFMTENSAQIGSALQVMLLSFALADRLNTEKKEKIDAQNLALEEERNARIANEKAIMNERLAREAREEALFLQKKAADSLEREVEEHTGQLNETLIRVKGANNQIMSSLRYARMIQMAILPDIESARTLIPGLVAWWAPRDLVGGDFYYIEPVRDGFLVAVADCTGRGVAGAFMTIIAGSELKRIVKGEDTHDPGDILVQLNKRIRKALRQDTKRSLADDGLDIGICVVNRKNRTLAFSGANIDMVYTMDGTVYTLKGDRKSVGFHTSSGHPGYAVQSLKIEGRMTVYIYTDGVTDQLGEGAGQRFGSRRLKELISEYSRLPVSVQCEIIKASSEVYRGGREQVDDMTMMAFEIKV